MLDSEKTTGPPRPRPELLALPEYRAGKAAPAMPGLPSLKLSSNERCDDASEDTKAKLVSGCSFNRYPDPLTTELRTALAGHLGVPSRCIVTESGSLGALRLLLDAVVPRDGLRAEVIYPWRSFEAYPILIEVAGARGVAVPLASNGTHDLEAMAAAIGDRTAAIFICSPNNPTGPAIRAEDFARFMERVPRHVLVVIDEAYAEYVDDPVALSGITVQRAHDNVAVLRTFSKAYGLAGLRIGYAVVAPEIAEAMWRIRPTFAVSALAEHAAVLALGDRTGLAHHTAEVQTGRRAILAALRAVGERPPESQANFVWFEPVDPDRYEVRAAAAAVSVRRLDSGIRITVGDAASTDRVLRLIVGDRG